MKHFSSVIFLGLVLFFASSPAFAWGQLLQRVELEPRVSDGVPLADFIENSEFCFQKFGEKKECYSVTPMPEYSLIEDAKLNPTWKEVFTADQKKILMDDFSLLKVRFLAASPVIEGHQAFALELLYAGFPGIDLHLFVFGDLSVSQNGDVTSIEVREFADSQRGEAILRKLVVGWRKTDQITGNIVNFVTRKVLEKHFQISP